jgi:hypothetical protein
MGIEKVISMQAQYQQSVSVDTRTQAEKLDKNVGLNAKNRQVAEDWQKAIEAKAADLEQKAKDSSGFWGGVKSFFGDDGGVSDAKHDLAVEQATAKKVAGEAELHKTDLADAASDLSDSIQAGNRVQEQITKAINLKPQVPA